MSVLTSVAAYAVPAASIWGIYSIGRFRSLAKAREILTDATEAGLTEPPSLHPAIDTDKCIGCNSCALACPEGNVLGIVEEKATLIDPTRCIGHGACAAACPVGAIQLVFGTEKRGMDIPWVSPEFQTNVPGIYIAGELGGMGLIRNAVTQGREAVENIARTLTDDPAAPDELDLFIVGAGPTGIAASLGATKAGLRFKTAEQDSLGGTVAHYPRGKVVMTAPVELPLYGTMDFRSVTKEELIALWTQVIDQTGVEIGYDERVISIDATETGFAIETSAGSYRAKKVLLAIGRRGSPRKLGVPGEDGTNVLYRLKDPEDHIGKRVLVVGGGDSALEAAIAMAETQRIEVTLSYRGEAFSRARKLNRDRIDELATSGQIDVMLASEVKEIAEKVSILRSDGIEEALPNDVVIICAGGVLPIPLLEKLGVEIERKHGTA
ncbi:4Fe-4S dicluster domain-containing protein [Erythrobacter vulgaris]|uniref:4Fe-4S dicluster domain-containing protein n=1 Tax=Qipengyuania vulgaris TaxID=291985 RepID=A0A844XQL2_9SPHN|nr:NAD(P)-binding domain-containing protein [Qipengyuania vulgaris]MXO47473.1 4Fe-4S dicluster domain-containing protein [Qipengyuania vulgaris]